MACAPNLLLCFVSLSVRVALKLRSLRIHSPHLCRSAVFSVQTNVSLITVVMVIIMMVVCMHESLDSCLVLVGMEE